MLEEEIVNPRYPHHIRIVRRSLESVTDDEDPLAVEGKDVVLYDGEGRSFTDTTTYGGASVDTNKRKASIPVRFDEWEEGQKPLDGDSIEAVIGCNTEFGRVRDCESDNNRTIVYWDFVRV